MSDRRYDDGARPHLSEAAVVVLNELMETRRREVVERALESSNGGPVVATDIVRAFYDEPISARRSFDFVPTSSPASTARKSFVVLILGLVMTTVIVVFASIRRFEDPNVSLQLWAIAGVAIALLGFTTWLYVRARAMARQDEAILDIQRTILSDLTQTTGAQRESWPAGSERMEILAAWSELESLIRTLHRSRFDRSEKSLPSGLAIRELVNNGTVDEKLYLRLRSILKVRNEVAHQRDVTRNELRQALDSIRPVSQQLEALIKDEDAPDHSRSMS